MRIIGDALAGHAHRVSGHPKAKRCDNPLTDFVNLVIAQKKAEMNMKKVEYVDLDVCIDCWECCEVCPVDCFEDFEFNDCNACGMCLDVCPVGAIIVEGES